MKELAVLTLLLKNELLTSARLLTGGLCSAAGLDLDASEDCKVCVTESLLLLMHGGYREARIFFTCDGGLAVRAEGTALGAPAGESPEDDISAALLSALAEGVSMEKEDGSLRAIGFRFANGR